MTASAHGSLGKEALGSLARPRWRDIAVRALRASGVVCTLLAASQARPADACGGAFFVETAPDVVSVRGHEMAISISKAQTVVWDRIDVEGNPEELAWVIPVHDGAKLDVAADAFFVSLAANTAPRVNGPQQARSGGGDDEGGGCGAASDGTAASAPGASGDGAGSREVTVIERQTVGPYDTARIRATDPGSAGAWLAKNGFRIPADIQPVLDAYTREGFEFIALRVRPGATSASLVPLRLTTPGADPTLPLRMSRAGLKSRAELTLYVIAETRYKAQGFGEVLVDEKKLTYDVDTGTSNYRAATDAQLAQVDHSLLVEFANPDGLGRINEPGAAGEAAIARTGMGSAVWITRLRGNLPVSAFATDMRLEPHLVPEIVSNVHQAPNRASGASVSPLRPSRGVGSAALVVATMGALVVLFRRRRTEVA
jgi:hypothetical protein